ncbi:hypothetical protein BDV97DRAFT_228078 [Delphinella strobiligena]|nr:hypothetical protein BDV97DRAFT_228078 [Delphinella strobiligena]
MHTTEITADTEARPGNGRPARDPHALPPDHICEAYWKYNKIKPSDLDVDPEVVDFSRGLSAAQQRKIHAVKTISSETIAAASRAFKFHGQGIDGPVGEGEEAQELNEEPKACTVYEHDDFPGLQVYSSLLPPEIQVLLLSRILHRDLSNPHHKTNINADYNVPYPTAKPTDPTSPSTSNHLSFFTLPPQSGTQTLLTPKEVPENTNKPKPPLNMAQYLLKKLRWLTLGHQYDWPTRSYSGHDSTRFPSDIRALVRALFPSFESESGVVLLYSPKDYMPVHRDVSEQCTRGLASFSLGCDGLFVIAKDTSVGGGADAATREDASESENERESENESNSESKIVVLRVKSGDVVYMDGETRWAWHAMPKVLAGTCPDFMAQWPAGSEGSMGVEEGAFEKWRGFMAGKRLNISCRQVFD